MFMPATAMKDHECGSNAGCRSFLVSLIEVDSTRHASAVVNVCNSAAQWARRRQFFR